MAENSLNRLLESLGTMLAWILVYITIIASILLYILLFSKDAKYKCWIFHADSVPAFGTIYLRCGRYYIMLMKKRSLALTYANIYAKFVRDKYVRIFYCWKKQVLIKDLEMVNKVLVTDSYNFEDKATLYYNRHKDHFQNLDDPSLKSISHLASLAVGNITEKHPIILNCAKMLEDLESEISHPGAPLEWHSMFLKYGLDVITTIMFGVDTITKYKSQILEMTTTVGEAESHIIPIIQYATLQHIESIDRRPLNIDLITSSSMKHYNDLLDTSLRDGQINNYEGSEGTQILMANLNHIKDEDYQEKMATNVALQAFTFVSFASELEETMSLCLHELATNVRVQNRLYRALYQLPDLSYQSLMSCEYLDMVISETLRKYPPVSFLQRECIDNYQFTNDELGMPSLSVTKGTQVYISIQGIHKDPSLFQEPDQFDPDRFSKDNKGKIKPLSYIPFGTGPTCGIDTQFIIVVIKTGLATLLQRYRIFLPNNDTLLEIEPRTNTPMEDDNIWLCFEQRANQMAGPSYRI